MTANTPANTLHAAFAGHVAAALAALEAAGTLPAGLNHAAVTVEPPRDPSHGDLATNVAMVLTKRCISFPSRVVSPVYLGMQLAQPKVD